MSRQPRDWYDWVVVERVLRDQPTGRYLSRAEKLMVTRGIIARGGRLNDVLRLTRCNHADGLKLWIEAGGEL